MKRFLLCLAALAALAAAPAALAQDVPPTVTPDIGPPGTRFLFGATGFAPNERLSFWLNRPDGQVVTAFVTLQRANDRGSAVWNWTAPDDTAEGGWQMVAHGRVSGFERVIGFAIGNPPPQSAAPSNVEPRSGDPGALFRFFVTGFAPGEYVDVRVRSPGGADTTDGLRVAQPANENGRIDGSWTSPNAAAPGDWRIIARGADSGVERIITVTIEAPGAARPRMDASPDVGAPGQRFSFSAVGFAPEEELSIWLNLPNGKVVAATIEGVARAAPDGRAGWAWVAPSEGPTGPWQMVAHGRTSGVEVVATFTLRNR